MWATATLRAVVAPFTVATDKTAQPDTSDLQSAQVIIHGAQRDNSDPTVNMPAFGEAYSDAEVASVANYVTAWYGTRGSTLNAGRVAELREQD